MSDDFDYKNEFIYRKVEKITFKSTTIYSISILKKNFD